MVNIRIIYPMVCAKIVNLDQQIFLPYLHHKTDLHDEEKVLFFMDNDCIVTIEMKIHVTK
jgi:hypothetical protein